jgi:hypothetical protein
MTPDRAALLVSIVNSLPTTVAALSERRVPNLHLQLGTYLSDKVGITMGPHPGQRDALYWAIRNRDLPLLKALGQQQPFVDWKMPYISALLALPLDDIAAFHAVFAASCQFRARAETLHEIIKDAEPDHNKKIKLVELMYANENGPLDQKGLCDLAHGSTPDQLFDYCVAYFGEHIQPSAVRAAMQTAIASDRADRVKPLLALLPDADLPALACMMGSALEAMRDYADRVDGLAALLSLVGAGATFGGHMLIPLLWLPLWTSDVEQQVRAAGGFTSSSLAFLYERYPHQAVWRHLTWAGAALAPGEQVEMPHPEDYVVSQLDATTRRLVAVGEHVACCDGPYPNWKRDVGPLSSTDCNPMDASFAGMQDAVAHFVAAHHPQPSMRIATARDSLLKALHTAVRLTGPKDWVRELDWEMAPTLVEELLGDIESPSKRARLEELE